jgi:hypothetical protein
MYAGVGRTTGLPGGVKCSMTACRAVMTSGSGLIHAGGTSQPYRRACQSAQARAMSAAACVGR